MFTYNDQAPVKMNNTNETGKQKDPKKKAVNTSVSSPNFIVKSVISKLNLAPQELNDSKDSKAPKPSNFNG